MTFEKQQCCKCKKVCYCILYYSKTKGDWYCDQCYSWVIEDASIKDKMILEYNKLGIENLEC